MRRRREYPCSPTRRSGRPSIAWRRAPACRLRDWRGAPGLIRPRSTNRSASRRRAAPRWPSTKSIAKALTATATPIDAFLELINPSGTAATRAVPLIGFAEAGAGGYFDDAGFPVGEGWDEIAFPAVSDEHAYALEVSGHSMEPAYRDGDVILRVAGGADPPRRPRRGQDQGRRGAGEGAQAADGKIDRAALAQYRARATARWRRARCSGSRASSGRASRIFRTSSLRGAQRRSNP